MQSVVDIQIYNSTSKKLNKISATTFFINISASQYQQAQQKLKIENSKALSSKLIDRPKTIEPMNAFEY